ncbi:MAG: 2Fe-2S iron-sulfur cluster-binding protein, partial [bacterium]|nr:2Fe-2S iron-sulfur cluster-binding protein [bacterium]
MSPEHRVVFTPSGIESAAPEGSTVLDAARTAGVDIDSVCGGRGLCGRCQVAPGNGQFAKWGLTSSDEALSSPGPTELDYRG